MIRATPVDPVFAVARTAGPTTTTVAPATGLPPPRTLTTSVCGCPLTSSDLGLTETVAHTDGGRKSPMSRVVADALAAHGAAGTGVHAAKAVFVIVVPGAGRHGGANLDPYDCPATREPEHVSSLPARLIEHTPGAGWSMICVNLTPRGATSLRVAFGAGPVLEPRISYTNDPRPSASRNTVAGAVLRRESWTGRAARDSARAAVAAAVAARAPA